MPEYITDNIEISSGDFDREVSDKKILLMKVLMKKTDEKNLVQNVFIVISKAFLV